MVNKLPRWVEFGSFFLSALAGIVNAVALRGFEHQSVSHLSGVATKLGVELLKFDSYSFHLFLILISFLMGSAISGYLIESAALKLGRHYSFALFIEGLFLIISMFALLNGLSIGHYFASAACGLQNAMVTSYSGAIIRTTHVTGIFTDLGLMIGAWFKGQKLDKRKSLLFTLIIFGFILGGTLGATVFTYLNYMTLGIPAMMAITMAILYDNYIHKKH